MLQDFTKGPQKSAASAIKTYLLTIANEYPTSTPQIIKQSAYEA